MSESMVERVARAIWGEDGAGQRVYAPFEGVWTSPRERHMRTWLETRARAAIEAMREPTNEMCVAGWKVAVERDAILGNGEIAMIMEAMIDAALSDQAKEG